MRACALMIVLAASGGTLAACGSDSSTPKQVDVGPRINGNLELVDCNDWEHASTDERLGTIQELKGFAGGPVVGGEPNPTHGSGAVLDDKEAYDLLDNTCQNAFARGFKLYKLYERAASFKGQPQP